MTTAQAGSLRRARSAEARDTLHLADLTALTEAGLAIVRAQLDVDSLCQLVYQHVASIVDAQGFHLGLFVGDSFQIKVWVQNGVQQAPASFPLEQNEGIIGWLRSSQQPLLVRDFTQEMDSLPARPSYASENPPRSAVFVPLVAGDTVVGSMSVQHPQPGAFSEDDLRILAIIANQTASAITNARLFETVQRRAEQLATIAEAGNAITAILDLDELLTKVVELIHDRFGYYHVQVFLVEDEQHRAVFRASSGHQLNKLWREEGRSQPFGEGIIGWVAANGQHLLANDVSQEPRYIADDPRLLPDTRSELAVPLKVEDDVLGVLDVQSRDLEGFSGEDLFLLNALANQVAVAVDAAWSYRAQQEEAWITTVLLQVADVTNRVDTLDDVLGAVTRLVPMLAGVASCGIWLLDDELAVFEPASAHGLQVEWPEAQAGLRLRPTVEDAPALVLLQEDHKPVALEAGEEGMLPEAMWTALPGDRVMLLPLLVQNRLIGFLTVSFQHEDMPVRLHSKRMAMLNGIANQAAAAIETVRLSTSREEEAWISWALLEVSRAIGNAHSVDAMLEQVVRIAPLLAGIDRCAALLRDPESGEFVVSKEYLGRGETAGRFTGLRLAPGELPLLDLAVSTRQLQRVDDVNLSQLVPAIWGDTVGSKTLVALPLVVQGEVLGALLVDDMHTSYMVSQRREDILNGIAQQVGLALENFLLQAQEKDRVRMAQELQVAQRIQASFLPERTPLVPGYDLAHAWQSAREVGGDFYDFIELEGGGLGLLMADVADKGVPAALFMATSLTLLRVSAQNYATPDGMLNRANRLIGANNSSDMFVTVWYGILDPGSHRVSYANAGHSLAFHVKAGDGEIRQLRAPGMPLGVLEDASLQAESLVLEPGDCLVLYTDGVTDALDEEGDDFGQDRLEGVLYARRNGSAREIVDAVMASLRGHAGSAPVADDISMVVVKRQAGEATAR